MCTHGDLGTHPHLGSPSSLPKPDPRPEHTLGCGHKLWIPGLELGVAGHIYTLSTYVPLLPEPSRHPKAARTHRLAPSPPPAPQHLSPGMPWEAEAGPVQTPMPLH